MNQTGVVYCLSTATFITLAPVPSGSTTPLTTPCTSSDPTIRTHCAMRGSEVVCSWSMKKAEHLRDEVVNVASVMSPKSFLKGATPV